MQAASCIIIIQDIASRSVILDQNEKCKIGNFNHLVRAKELVAASANIATDDYLKIVRWMAPESIGKKKCFSIASDVWSYGVLQWEMKNPTKDPYDVSIV